MTLSTADREEVIFGIIGSQMIGAYQGVEALEQQAKALLRTVSTASSIAGVLPGNREQEDRCRKVQAVLTELAEACSEARNSFGQI
jgi:hypothetical protein